MFAIVGIVTRVLKSAVCYLIPVFLVLIGIVVYRLNFQEMLYTHHYNQVLNDPEIDFETKNQLLKLQNTYDAKVYAKVLCDRMNEQENGLVRLREHYYLSLAGMLSSKGVIEKTEVENFLISHIAVLEQNTAIAYSDEFSGLLDDYKQKNEEYLRILSESVKDETEWERIKNNPMMVFFKMQGISDSKILDFYQQEEQGDYAGWLDDLIVGLLAGDEEGELTAQEILNTAYQYHPLLRDALRFSLGGDEESENDLHSVFSLFYNYGGIIQHSVKDYNIPLDDLLDVLFTLQATQFLSEQSFFTKSENLSDKKIAEKLNTVFSNYKNCWNEAKTYGFCIELADDYPVLAEKILSKYPQFDIGTLIYTYYPDPKEINGAVEAIDMYEDLAIKILYQYSDSSLFHENLGLYGKRIVLYAAIQGEKGFEQLRENPAWLDKYVDKEGKPKEKEWWKLIPIGGAIAEVACNMRDGIPNTWGDLGWAALDLTDIFAGEGLVAKKMAKGEAKIAIKKEIKEAVEKGVKNQSSRKVGQKIASEVESNTLRSMSKKMGKTARIFRTANRLGVRYIAKPVSAVWRGGIYTFDKASDIWKMVPEAKKVLLYKSYLVSGLIATTVCRTIPEWSQKLPQIAEITGSYFGKIVNNVKQMGPAAINGFTKEVVGKKKEKCLDIAKIIISLLFLFSGVRMFVIRYRKRNVQNLIQ